MNEKKRSCDVASRQDAIKTEETETMEGSAAAYIT
jgi:hypothetical protein